MKHGPNIIAVQVVTALDRFYIMGCHIPLNNLTTWGQVEKAWINFPKGCHPMLLGDLNDDFDISTLLGGANVHTEDKRCR